jgi:hypothetical protein
LCYSGISLRKIMESWTVGLRAGIWPCGLANAKNCYQHQTQDTALHNDRFTPCICWGVYLINTNRDAIRLIPAAFGSLRQAVNCISHYVHWV